LKKKTNEAPPAHKRKTKTRNAEKSQIKKVLKKMKKKSKESSEKRKLKLIGS